MSSSLLCRPAFLAPLPLSVINQRHASSLSSPRTSLPARTATPRAVFDFVRKAADEQRKAFDALRSGNALEYAKDKVARDIEQVRKFNDGLAASRDRLARDLANVVGQGDDVFVLEDVLEDLSDVLIMADLGVDTVDKIVLDLRREAREDRLREREDIKGALKKSLVRILREGAEKQPPIQTSDQLVVVMVIGANGMGKTTTIGKLASRLNSEGNKVLVAACDTFRAAAVEQLEEWVRRADVDIVKSNSASGNPSSVLYSALEKAQKESFDYLIVDTSGRLHNNVNLMGELQKMFRVVGKFKENGPDETLLVVDASIGRNAVTQARTWKKEVGVTGLAVTKLDGTARAGFVVSCVDELGLPVRFIGVGEGVDDLRDFDAELFVDGLLGE